MKARTKLQQKIVDRLRKSNEVVVRDIGSEISKGENVAYLSLLMIPKEGGGMLTLSSYLGLNGDICTMILDFLKEHPRLIPAFELAVEVARKHKSGKSKK
jgi:hypothetical protein